MKLLMENWRTYLKEVDFYDSPDEDRPGKNQMITFSDEDKYTVGGKTHGAASHMIKHYLEFEPSKVSAGLKQALQKAQSFDNFFLKNVKSGEPIAIGDEAKKAANENAMLNTFDLINDKIENKEPLSDEEKQLQPIISALTQEYQALVKSYMSDAVDVENTTDVEKIKQVLDSGKTIKFVGSYSGSPFQYFLNTSNTGLVAYQNGKVATLFRIDKKGNDLGKVVKYFSRGVELQNSALSQALASSAGKGEQQPQKKQEPKKQQQNKPRPGDIVKRLKQAKKSDEEIKQVLSKAFPKLPEKAVDNMLSNIQEKRN